MEEAILLCGQMSANPALYAELAKFQSLLVESHSVMGVLSSVAAYPFAERVHFSRTYSRLYEAVMSAINIRNSISRVEPTVLYIAGPAGIMKTTVAEEIASRIAKKLYPDEFANQTYKYDRILFKLIGIVTVINPFAKWRRLFVLLLKAKML
jgi:hypothetical protein